MLLRILIFIRSDVAQNKGGDYFQALQYRDVLQSRGHVVEITHGPREDLEGFDVVHLFNIHRIVETHRQFRHAQAAGLKTVLTPIWHSETHLREVYRRLYKIPRFAYPVAKVLREWRYCRNNRIATNRAELLKCTDMQRQVLQEVDFVVPNSRAECSVIEQDLGNQLEAVRTIPNTVSELFHELEPENASGNSRNGILCVGRIEPLKNQLRVCQAYALGSGDQPLEFIGKQGSHAPYFNRFLHLVDRTSNASYVGELSQQELAAKYLKARGIIHASHFETTGLIGMEALCCGAAVCITDTECTREYYEGVARFCDPDRITSIRDGIDWLMRAENVACDYRPPTREDIGQALELTYREVLRM